MAEGTGSKEDPWVLTTPPGSSSYSMYETRRPTHRPWCAGSARPPSRTTSGRSTTSTRGSSSRVTGCRSARPTRRRRPRGTVEAWGRSPDNPVEGWYGLRNGYRGRFGMYLPPLLEALGLAEVTHDPRNNAMRAI